MKNTMQYFLKLFVPIIIFQFWAMTISGQGDAEAISDFQVEFTTVASKSPMDLTIIKGKSLYVLEYMDQHILRYNLITGKLIETKEIIYPERLNSAFHFRSIVPYKGDSIALKSQQLFVISSLKDSTIHIDKHKFNLLPNAMDGDAQMVYRAYITYPELTFTNDKAILPIRLYDDDPKILFDPAYYERPIFSVYELHQGVSEIDQNQFGITGAKYSKYWFVGRYPSVYLTKKYLPHYQNYYYATDATADEIYVVFEATPDVFIYDLSNAELKERVAVDDKIEIEPMKITPNYQYSKIIRSEEQGTEHYANALFDTEKRVMTRLKYLPEHPSLNELQFIDLETGKVLLREDIAKGVSLLSLDEYRLVTIDEEQQVKVYDYARLEQEQ